jgi:hypothetical protein
LGNRLIWAKLSSHESVFGSDEGLRTKEAYLTDLGIPIFGYKPGSQRNHFENISSYVRIILK